MDVTITPATAFRGVFSVPGDKSISHRAVMLGALAEGTTTIRQFLNGDDCMRTIACFQQLGVDIQQSETNPITVTVKGVGLRGLSPSATTLDVGNSGTTIRLLSGILAGQPFATTITGDESIQRRPMKRIFDPLTQMGATISGTETEKGITAPLHIKGGLLHAIRYAMPVASAQLKSAILFASLYADGVTEVVEPAFSRNHTELMLKTFGARLTTTGRTITVHPVDRLLAQEIIVPGDISSAAFLMVAACLVPDSDITITNVGINPTRSGVITALQQMGGDITVLNPRVLSGEPVADIRVRTSALTGISLSGEMIPNCIDEIPIIAVAAAFAKGVTTIADAKELKVKESNRIAAMVSELSKMNVAITETADGMVIRGGNPIHANTVTSYHDHRIAMSLAVAGLMADDKTIIKDGDCTAISFPNFYDTFARFAKEQGGLK